MNHPVSRITRGLLRLGAGLLALVVIVGPIIVMAAVAGNPLTGDLAGSLGDRQIGNDQIIKLFSLAFYALWAWFAIPALRQVAVSLTTPATPTRRPRTTTPAAVRAVARPSFAMPADAAGPRGWLAQLVRFALGAATVATTITTVSTGFVPTVSAAPTTVVVHDASHPHDTTAVATPTDDRVDQVSHVTAQRRDTPYSIARRHFASDIDAARDEIVALNTGRPTPHGTPWSGGSFPVGMNVITPHFETDTSTSPGTDDATTTTTYRVRLGDGWINVVEGLWGDGAGDRWQELRLQLVGQHVAPGVVITADTTTIHPDWVFTHPDTTPAETPAAGAIRVVEPGDTLHDLVDDVVDEPVSDRHIDAVARHNDSMATPDGRYVFSASNPDLIHPGQVVDLNPAIDLDTPAHTFDDPPTAPAEREPEATGEPVDVPGDVSVDEPADMPVEQPAPVEQPVDPSETLEEVDPPDAADVTEAQPPDDRQPPTVDSGDELDAPAAPAPPITAPAPPVPIPTNAVATQADQPGDSAATPPTTVANRTTSTSDTTGLPVEFLAAGGLGLAGLFITLERRRRKARTKRPAGTTIAAPNPTTVRNEHIMRAAAHVDRATRVNLAVRRLGRQLAQRDAPLRAHYLLADSDNVTVVFDRPIELADGWTQGDHPKTWTCRLTDDELAICVDDPTPWPALTPIGTLDDGTDVIIDIEGLGSLAITGPDDIVDQFLAAVVTSISSSPYADILTFVDDQNIALHGLDRHLQHRLAVDSIDALIARLGHWITPFNFDDQHLLAARRQLGSEYEPCIAALVTNLTDEQRNAVRALPLDGSHPIAVLTTDSHIAGTILDIDADGHTVLDGHRVRCHRLQPVTAATAATLFDLADSPDTIDTAPLDEYQRLTASTPNTIDSNDTEHTEPTPMQPVSPSAVSIADLMLPTTAGQLFDTEPDLDWTVRVLGPLEIVHRDGTHLTGPKVRELATLLAMHPAGVPSTELKRMLGKSEEAGISTRISELRKLLGQGDTVAGRTYLPANRSARGYHLEGIRVDSVRLARCLDHARKSDRQDKINWLVGALELVRGQIGTAEFTSFQWAGHLLNTLEASIVEAGVELADLAAEHDNWTIVDWAANQVRLANPYEQRVIPLQIEARRALGDDVSIRRLHDEALNDVDEFEPDVQAAFHTALARQAR